MNKYKFERLKKLYIYTERRIRIRKTIYIRSTNIKTGKKKHIYLYKQEEYIYIYIFKKNKHGRYRFIK